MQDLIERIKQQRLDNPPLFVYKEERPIPLPRTVTPEELAQSEALLGFSLPSLLRELYMQVGNGCFGPEYGILGITPAGWKDAFGNTALSAYLDFLAQPAPPEKFLKVIPICYYGCAEHIYLDCKTLEGRILPYGNTNYVKSYSLEDWLEEWLGEGGSMFVLAELGFEDDGTPRPFQASND